MQRSTLQEMAAKYRRTPKAFSAYVRQIGIPFEQVGRSMLFDPVAVELFLAAQRPEPKPGVVRQFVRRDKQKGGGRLAERLGL